MKITYENIKFDSELEVEYYKYLNQLSDVLTFIYHPESIKLSNGNSYTPDFIVFYKERIEIVETKGYNQFSFMRDNLIHNLMKQKTEQELYDYVEYQIPNNLYTENDCVIAVYKKIKYLKKYGWVDFEFKNPNTIANNRKQKIIELEAESKELKNTLKNYDRYFTYANKIKNGGRLTKAQDTWYSSFCRDKQI